MASLSSKIVGSFVRLTRKGYYTSAQTIINHLKKERQREDHTPPGFIQAQFNVHSDVVGNQVVYEMCPKHAAPQIDILYLHGGGYVFEITHYHWKFLARLCQQINTRIVIPIYPLAPENHWQRVFDTVMPVLKRMSGSDSTNPLVLMGDSAGGGLALAVSMQASKTAIAQPDQLILLSPWVDLTMSNPAIAKTEPKDPMLSLAGVKEVARLYTQGSDPESYLLSPLYGDLSNLPPTSLFTGTHDILYPDAVALFEKAKLAGALVELYLEEEYVSCMDAAGFC